MTEINISRFVHSSSFHRIFYSPNGVRAGWRLLIFFGIGYDLFAVKNFLFPKLTRGTAEIPRMVLDEALAFTLFLFISWIMARLEKKSIAEYGLPWRQILRSRFWQGAAVGFAAMTVLLAAMHAIGVFDFGTISLHGADLWRWAGMYGLLFMAVGLNEEFQYRGYVQFTLSSGIRFWPSAVVWSAFFAFDHTGNTGESTGGLVNVVIGGLFFCLLLQRSGNLWMPIGFHAAWDWAQTFVYGVPDSGSVLPGHLMNPRFAGPALLTGGTVGPEGSLLCTLLLLILCFLIVIRYPHRREAR